MTERERFERCLAVVLKHEGGFVDHPRDPGGATALGVTLETAKEAKLDVDGDGDTDVQDLKTAKPKDVAPLYRKRYWKASHCDELPAGLDLAVFDTAVNMGPVRARIFLQQACGVKADGIVGKQTLVAVKVLGAKRVIAAMELLRKAHYRSRPHFPTFGRGWLRRLDEVTRQALEWG